MTLSSKQSDDEIGKNKCFKPPKTEAAFQFK